MIVFACMRLSTCGCAYRNVCTSSCVCVFVCVCKHSWTCGKRNISLHSSANAFGNTQHIPDARVQVLPSPPHHPLNPREQELTRQQKEKVFTSLISAKEELSQKDITSPTPLRQARTADEPSQPGNNQLSQHASG